MFFHVLATQLFQPFWSGMTWKSKPTKPIGKQGTKKYVTTFSAFTSSKKKTGSTLLRGWSTLLRGWFFSCFEGFPNDFFALKWQSAREILEAKSDENLNQWQKNSGETPLFVRGVSSTTRAKKRVSALQRVEWKELRIFSSFPMMITKATSVKNICYTSGTIIMVQSKMGESPVGSLPFK